MKPLRDESSRAAPDEAYGLALLRSASPTITEPAAQARVRKRIEAQTQSTVKRRWYLAWAPASALLIASVATAAVVAPNIVRRWSAESSSQQAPPHKVHQPAQARSQEATAPLASPASQIDEDLVAPTVSAAPSPERAQPQRLPSRLTKRRAVSEPASPAAAIDDPSLLFAAMRSLRNGGDPGAASAQLDEYLRRYPQGDLVEEAMALALDAARAQQRARTSPAQGASLSPSPEVVRRARTYLARFPHGRFAGEARRVLGAAAKTTGK